MDKVNLNEKFHKFSEHWSPCILGELNGSYVKVFKAKGEFVWHKHDHEDEFFLVVKGQLNIKLRGREIALGEGEFFIVPKGVEHMPYAADEAWVMLFEPKDVLNTGNAESDKTVRNLRWI